MLCSEGGCSLVVCGREHYDERERFVGLFAAVLFLVMELFLICN